MTQTNDKVTRDRIISLAVHLLTTSIFLKILNDINFIRLTLLRYTFFILFMLILWIIPIIIEEYEEAKE